MSAKTNAIRLVEKANIPCEEKFYEYSEDDLSGAHAAQVLGIPEVFCIPVCEELDLKKAAKAAGDKNMELVHVKELLNLTGYIRGGCSPIGMKKKYPTFFDELCLLCEEIALSAGERGHQIIVPPEPVMQLTGAKAVDLTK